MAPLDNCPKGFARHVQSTRKVSIQARFDRAFRSPRQFSQNCTNAVPIAVRVFQCRENPLRSRAAELRE